MATPDAISLAGQQIGLNENAQTAAIQEYLSNGGVNLDPSVTAWCAAFVNATLAQSGQEGTGSNMARSFETWGQEVNDPMRGDLAVFSRGDPNGPYGHVGFFDGYNEDGTIRVLGGNQDDSVSISNYSPDQLLGFRRGGDAQPAEQGIGYAPPTPQNALSEQPNALASPQLQLATMDPEAFMNRRNRNALQPVSMMPQPNPLMRSPYGA